MQMLLNVTSQMLPEQTGDHAFSQSVHLYLMEQHWYATINTTPVHTSKTRSTRFSCFSSLEEFIDVMWYEEGEGGGGQ